MTNVIEVIVTDLMESMQIKTGLPFDILSVQLLPRLSQVIDVPIQTSCL